MIAQSYSANEQFFPYLYLFQLARAWRFLARYQVASQSHGSADIHPVDELEDMFYAVFQAIWHVKDWIDNDDNLPEATRKALYAAVHANKDLLIAADLANGSKHLVLKNDHTGARDHALQLEDLPNGGLRTLNIVKMSDGTRRDAITQAKRCLVAWRDILEAHSLPSIVSG